MNRLSIYFFVFAFILISGCVREELTLEEAGQEVLRLLENEEFHIVHETWFSEKLQESLPEDELAETWKEKTINEEFIEIISLTAEKQTENLDTVEATLDYSGIQFDVRMIFNDNLQLVGFSLSDGMIKLDKPESIVEEEIIVGEGTEFELGGTLTLPVNTGEKLPAVVLVHGSGPNDRDETQFSYKPFRDLAWGLAEKGIVVLRYDKRTFSYGPESIKNPNEFTVYEEVVEDAVRATELLKRDSRIDEEKVFLAGHSLGGMLAPRIEVQGGDFAGLIILAGTPRPLWEVIYDQNLNSIEMFVPDEEEKEEYLLQIEEEYEKAKNLQHLTAEEAKEMTIFGIGGYYLHEMDEYKVTELISQIEKPFLVLQGEDDFQVFVEKDFVLWQEVLQNDKDATFINYPGLNHFFIVSEGPFKGTVQEYETPGLVETRVIHDIADWIHEQ